MTQVYDRHHYDATERQFIFERVQDVEPVLDAAKAIANNGGEENSLGRLIGIIPNVILERWINEDGVNYLALPASEFGRLVKRKLADPDWAFLRTGKI